MSRQLNLTRIKAVANALEGLQQEIVFVGGATVSLYADPDVSPEVRPTEDVDVIIELATYAELHKLEEKLGPILFQLPPMWHVNTTRLHDFLKLLPPYYRYTFEFRHPSWYTSEIYSLLQQYNAAFCIYELEYHLSPLEVTADFVYVRLHGPGAKYEGSYPEETLQHWATKCIAWQQQVLDVYVYFDNDQLGYAAFNAQRLQTIVQEQNQPENLL